MKALAQNTLIQNRYLIVHLIGKGGMGEVYLAVDQRLGSAVALKRTYFAGDEMLGNAFEREARILARMRHPVLPKVSDHFSENDEQYLVMEHISGDDLAKRLDSAKKPFPLSWVMFWADQLLDALSYLHSHEPPIIHRDIKPQNLKLTDENHIILLDFGLSKSSTGQTQLSSSGGSTGSVVGYTPHYAPMEQIRGIGTNAKSDLYSLSATLYQLLTNTIPADALTRADTMLNDMPDPITPPHELNPEIPRTVSEVILKGMEVSQEKRFTSAREMQKILRKAFNQIQEAMSAQTVAFNMQAEGVAAIDSSLQPPVPGASVPQPGKLEEAGYESLPLGGATSLSGDGAADPNAISGAGGVSEPVRQADVKTEVFLVGNAPFSVPGEPPIASPVPDLSGDVTDRSDISSFPPDATMPIASFENAADNGYRYDSLGKPETAAGAPARPDAFATVTAANSPYHQASRPEPVAKQAASARPAGKSGGKAFAVLSGVAALLVLAVGAAGAGWYIYTNYYAAPSAAEVSPSPEASTEPSPSPMPTVEAALEPAANSNVDTAAAEPDPGDTVPGDVTGAPTPGTAETGATTNPRPAPNAATRNAPPRPAGTPAAKATPKPKPREDRTLIYQ